MDNKKDVLEIVKNYAVLAQQKFNIKKMYFFGSQVNGFPREDSDIDIAVVMKNDDFDFLKTGKLLFKLRRQIDLRIEPLIVDENDVSGFLEEISKTGIRII